MPYLTGKLSDYEKSNKGYIAGSFFPNDTLNHDGDAEVAFKKKEPGTGAVAKHKHAKRKTYVIVTKGSMRWRIDGDEFELNAGDFLIFSAGTFEEILSVTEGTEHVVIHTPSPAGEDKKYE